MAAAAEPLAFHVDPLASIEALERSEIFLVIHFRMAIEPESKVHVREAECTRMFYLREYREGAEAARRCFRVEEGVHRGQRVGQHVGHRDADQAFTFEELQEDRRAPG